MIKQNNILQFQSLSQFPQLIHGFSTRIFGSMRPSHAGYYEAVSNFISKLQVNPLRLVRMNQVHNNVVHVVVDEEGGKVVPETDGLLTDQKQIFLGVITADCLPLFFYDPKKQIVAAVHAGWRGLYAEIIKEAVAKMREQGSNPKDILVGIGPSIRVCCYSVDEAFIEKFREKFGDVEQFLQPRDGKVFFDLQKCAKEQLRIAGISENNIEDGDYCTFDHTDVYSCRREGKDFGEMMGIIGMRNEI
ncbi:MAG TPA: peptidoglycan editing factor PgeF [Patescibacteria group bacterium]|nr:peptidoglycan editing factor PgeF [Patescibacteria group bacterium]